MAFARWLFWIAGAYGVIALLPLYIFANDYLTPVVGASIQSAETFYYGFVGVALAWQIAFLIIGCDPVRYRPLMIPAVLEKLSFGISTAVLYFTGRVAIDLYVPSQIDTALGILFAIAWWLTRSMSTNQPVR